MSEHTICLMNDSYPPIIDGVANVVVNYAANIEKNYGHAIVAAPEFPGADDSDFPYPVIRFPSLDTRKLAQGYVTGIPFSPELAGTLNRENAELLHVHCPMTSSILARELRGQLDVPMVMTYHTKYDIDIANVIRSKALQESSIKVLISNINAFDEVWAVSQGAGENLQSLGYQGDFIVMPNGVDLPAGRASESLVQETCSGYDLPENVPVFLFVGRLMWYKGLRIILDALKKLADSGQDFRMVFIGKGADGDEVKQYAKELGLEDKVFFTGAIYDREILRAWYTRGSLFLFPSTFDTNGLVVREAAACSLGSVLIAGSCAAEGVTDGRNALLIEENAESLAALLLKIGSNLDLMRQIGEHANNELYLSWEDAVKIAWERYEIVIDNYKCGRYEKRRRLSDSLLATQGNLMESLDAMEQFRLETEARRQAFIREVKDEWHEMKADVKTEWREMKADVKNDWHEMKADVKADWHEMKADVKTEWHEMKADVKADWHEMKADVKNDWHEMKTGLKQDVDAGFDWLVKIMEDWERYL